MTCTGAQDLYPEADGVTKNGVNIIFEGQKLSGDVTLQVCLGVRLVARSFSEFGNLNGAVCLVSSTQDCRLNKTDSTIRVVVKGATGSVVFPPKAYVGRRVSCLKVLLSIVEARLRAV